MNFLKRLMNMFHSIVNTNKLDDLDESSVLVYKIIGRLNNSGEYFELDFNGEFIVLTDSHGDVRDTKTAYQCAKIIVEKRLSHRRNISIRFQHCEGYQVGRWTATESLIDHYHLSFGDGSRRCARREIAILVEAKELTPTEVQMLKTKLTFMQKWIEDEKIDVHPSEVELYEKAQVRISIAETTI